VILRRLLLVLCALCFAGPVAAQTFPALSGRVVDQANLLSPADEAELIAKSEALERATSRQLVVATVSSLEGQEIEDYGYRLGRQWAIGQKEANNGTILLIAPNERKVRIEAGYGVEPILTDAYSSLIINNRILPAFKADPPDYPAGIKAGAEAIVEQLQAPPEIAEQKVLEAQRRQERAGQRRARSGDGGSFLTMIFWGMVALFVLLSMVRGRGRRGRRGPWGGRRYGGSDLPILLWALGSQLGSGGRSSGWGGSGGFGGGGGGGFGGFSGGGGSFGGGGASGSW
jgi:uncharacterized protein